jgi:hypothetical protein
MNAANQMIQASAALAYMLAGNSRTTLRSAKTGTRYTYKIKAAKNRPGEYFVELLTGPDNTADYTYMGMIRANRFDLTRNSTYKDDSLPVVALRYALTNMVAGKLPEKLEVWHEGACGRCNRPLTDPVSIARGLGPECAGKGN